MTPEYLDKLSELMSQAHTGTFAVLRKMCEENLMLQAENDSLRRLHDKTHQMIDRIHAALDYKPLGLTAEQAVEKAISILDEE